MWSPHPPTPTLPKIWGPLSLGTGGEVTPKKTEIPISPSAEEAPKGAQRQEDAQPRAETHEGSSEDGGGGV